MHGRAILHASRSRTKRAFPRSVPSAQSTDRANLALANDFAFSCVDPKERSD